MEPAYKTGSVIYVKEVDPKTLAENDVITFKMGNGMTATHRIVELVPDDTHPDIKHFRTKGDANDVTDGSLVCYEQVIGTPIFTIPYLGYLAAYIQQPPGTYVAIIISLALIFLVIAVDIITEEEEKNAAKKVK